MGCTTRNEYTKGIQHQYEVKEHHGQKLVIDHTTDLTWQQSGSNSTMPYVAATQYIYALNDLRFAGYNDWRLPTVEEAMSLMEPEIKNGSLYIDPVFDRTQRYIWTADKYLSEVAWVVNFFAGHFKDEHVEHDHNYARAVR
jgi:hypothetical protein